MEKNNDIRGVNYNLYRNYNVQPFRMVPKNAMLICQNIFSGKVVVKKSGFRFILPWYRSKLVDITKNVIDYPKEKYITSEGIYVEIDPALTVRIVDPIKFEFENANPFQELGILMKDVIRSFVKSKSANDLIGDNYSIEEKDPNNLFEAFEGRTGLHVSHLFFKNVTLPKELVDDFEKAKTQELENKRAIAEAKSKKEQAAINADAARIKTDAEVYYLTAIVTGLQDRGYDEKTISEVLRTVLLSGSNANIIANLGGNNSQEAAAAMILSSLNAGSTETDEQVRGRVLTRRMDTPITPSASDEIHS